MNKTITKQYNIFISLGLSLLVLLHYLLFIIRDFEDFTYGKSKTDFIFYSAVCFVFGFIIVFWLMRQITRDFTFFSMTGILALLFTIIYGFILIKGDMQDQMLLVFILLPFIIPSILLLIFIDRILVAKFGTKKVNKVERIIMIALFAIITFQMLRIIIQDAFID